VTTAQETGGIAQNAAQAGVSSCGKGMTREPFPYVMEVETARTCAEMPVTDALTRFNALASQYEENGELETRERERQEAEAVKEAETRLARFEELCPPAYRHPDMIAAMRERVPARVLDAAMNWQPCGLASGLLLHGETGGFKTTMLFELARRLVVESGERRVVLMRGDTLARDAAAAYGDPARTAAWADPFKRARWLFIDELFKGSVTPSGMSALFDIIEHRTAHLLPTVATSNANTERVAASAKDPAAQESVSPILRRIRGEPGRPGFFFCVHVPAPGGNRASRDRET